jgi:hypothetical protein
MVACFQQYIYTKHASFHVPQKLKSRSEESFMENGLTTSDECSLCPSTDRTFSISSDEEDVCLRSNKRVCLEQPESQTTNMQFLNTYLQQASLPNNSIFVSYPTPYPVPTSYNVPHFTQYCTPSDNAYYNSLVYSAPLSYHHYPITADPTCGNYTMTTTTPTAFNRIIVPPAEELEEDLNEAEEWKDVLQYYLSLQPPPATTTCTTPDSIV